jgi:adenylate kinase
VPQAHALDRMLKEKGLKLDAVIELKVDEDILLERIEKRIAETKARGEMLRPDDHPDVLRRRLLAYRDQTAPLVTYYRLQSVLRQLDGMAAVAEVARAIDDALEQARAGKSGQQRSETRSQSQSAGKRKGKKPAAKKATGERPVGKFPKRKGKSPHPSGRTVGSRKAPPRKSKRQRRLTKRG